MKKLKNKHAVALGKLGGLKGGPARAKALTAEELSKAGRNAANARWAKEKDGKGKQSKKDNH